MISSSAARYEHTSTTAVENEPLFSTDYEEQLGADRIDIGDRDRSDTTNASLQHETADQEARHSAPASSYYPPPKYLKSTYTSREHEYDASDDIIDTSVDADPDNVPVLTGLLQSARTRGSIETHRMSSIASANGDIGLEDAANEQGLVVGMGQGGGMLASVS